MLQQQQNNKFKILIFIIGLFILLFFVFPPLPFLLIFLFYKSGLSFDKFLKKIGFNFKQGTNGTEVNYQKNSKSKIYKKTAYPSGNDYELLLKKMKEKKRMIETKNKALNNPLSKIKTSKKNNYISKNNTNNPNYFNKPVKKSNKKYEYNAGKSIWDDYESVLTIMNK